MRKISTFLWKIDREDKNGYIMGQDNHSIKIALAGNPNVGKSTVFNALTGLRQHTGNWTGKTVALATGYRKENGIVYEITDLPGTYSLSAHSPEEEIARDHLLFSDIDAVAIVCDATHLARNLALVFQILEIRTNAVLVLNLMDEAKRNGITVDTERLSKLLGIPVVRTSASSKKGISDILPCICQNKDAPSFRVRYTADIEKAVEALLPDLYEFSVQSGISARFAALRILEKDEAFFSRFPSHREYFLRLRASLVSAPSAENVCESIAASLIQNGEKIASHTVRGPKEKPLLSCTDRIVTSRLLGIPLMLMLLLMVFWLTVVGANVPSELLASFFSGLEMPLYKLMSLLSFPEFLKELLVFGIYRTLTWIISVMLPPMAIFFPLFTLLEDVGYLPRVAFNLDGAFCRCGACGKQGLTMCMGLGCNAVGVTGARIIDGKRERLIAILTNSLIPCNGRFPAMITVASVFFIRVGTGDAFLSALLLAGAVGFGVGATFLLAFLLSKTLLKGTPGTFVLELPPYRKPQIIKTVLRSVLDRTVVVLGRAVAVAAPAGALIWLLANLTIGDLSISAHISRFLDPLGRWMGLDGVILLAFLLGLPANEIVLPLCLMLYRSDGMLTETLSLSSVSELLTANGWTWQTAILFLVFTVLHSPCTTTLLTVKRETGKFRYALLAFLLPTALGIGFCIILHAIFSVFAA
jgi:ferrous iron transport protein B